MKPVQEHPLLIIECDTGKLASDGLSCAHRVADVAGLFGIEPIVLKTTTVQNLVSQLGTVGRGAVFDAVVIIAHGNELGIRLSADGRFATWPELVRWLAPLEPQRLAFISCKAGRTLAARILFEGLEHLEEIFASPLNLSLLQSRAFDVLMPALLNPDLDESFIHTVQWMKPILAGGFLFRWTRQGHDGSDLLSDVLGTVVEQWVLPSIGDAVDELMGHGRRRTPGLPRPESRERRSVRR